MKNRFCFLVCGCLFLAAPGPGSVRGDEVVRQVQEELRKRHLFFGDIDGHVTPQVSAALRRYQERKGFPVTGLPDGETLRSLSLPPALAASPNGGARPAASPWPDMTVLRSDHARRTPLPDDAGEPPESGAEPPPTPAPPPAAATAQRLPLQTAREFVGRYLRAGQTNDAPAENTFYGEKVDYLNEGTVDRAFIAKDSARYNARWPERQFTLLDDTLKVTSWDGLSLTRVEFQYRFTVKRRKYTVQGKVEATYTLSGSQPGDLRIVGIKEQRVRP
jgi:peptidoglycan hydrolase-like protein with peptidoglycan-binding domain